MKRLLYLAILGTLAVAAPSMAADSSQEKACNARAEGKKGDERAAFMKTCLAGNEAAAAKKQQEKTEKMRECNAKAEGKKGDERRAFMAQCLKG